MTKSGGDEESEKSFNRFDSWVFVKKVQKVCKTRWERGDEMNTVLKEKYEGMKKKTKEKLKPKNGKKKKKK